MQLNIQNFRGIREAQISFDENEAINCLIGPGDSTKSTILKAIEYVFYPSYTLSLTDLDFYECNTSAPIVIAATITQLPPQLLTEQKGGLYLRCAPPYDGDSDDPEDDNVYLTIQLEIDQDLEPHWTLIKNGKEPRSISQSDRKLLPVKFIGESAFQDLTWAKSSVLNQLLDDTDELKSAHIKAMRHLVDTMQFKELDSITSTVVQAASSFGLSLNEEELQNKYLFHRGTLASSVGLYENHVPIFQRGTGTQVLLSAALEITASASGAILLIDEIETGLEPHRLRSFIAALRDASTTGFGQILFTTHSPVAIRELNIAELLAIRSNSGSTDAIKLSSPDSELNDGMQGTLRRAPDAFLGNKVIVCEGKTELGIVWSIGATHLSKYGATCVDSNGGTNMFKYAKHLNRAGYSVCIAMDSDVDNLEADKNSAGDSGIKILDTEPGNCIEEQIFKDIPSSGVLQLIDIAKDFKGEQSIKDKLRDSGFLDYSSEMRTFDSTQRMQLGKASNSGGWFKTIEQGEKVAQVVYDHLEQMKDKHLQGMVSSLLSWIKNNDD